ncbi:potassium-transporting ATPase subunit KdpC [Cellulomonas sp. NPDC057328]|uniref:potassium-transporting ATPase subunit KdpC n=1 Tax=Cellulomonas sp. NPDC057328 TaxID=3346101 RepID=UPI00362A21F7
MPTTTVPTPTRAPSAGSTVAALARHALAGLRVLLALTVVLGVAYPLAVTGVAAVALPWQARGSLVTADGARTTDPDEAVGSLLVGQAVDGDGWFRPRPSAAGDGYDTLASAGSNLGPESPDLLAAVEQRRAEVAAREDVDPALVPPDALTGSASGLDPDVSPAYAHLQVARVARENGLEPSDVAALVDRTTVGRDLGVLGEPRVNVLRLNLALRTMTS